MSPTQAPLTESAILAEGAVIERLRRDPAVRLDPLILNAALLFDPAGKRALGAIYAEYIAIGAEHDLPLTLCTPTWRANPERVRLASSRCCEEVNEAAVAFLQEMRSSSGPYARKILIAGLLGCRGDAYHPREGLEEEASLRFHASQARALAQAGADFLLAATLPAAGEARGLAGAMSATGTPYVLSFVLRPAGTLLDGTPLHKVIRWIDAHVDPPPLGYWANCTHPSAFSAALRVERQRDPEISARMIGLQANASARPPEELDGSARVFAEDAGKLADMMIALRQEFGTRVLGGCCGTDGRHIRAIAQRLACT